MKIFRAEQLRALDAYTIAHEPIASIDLMERAAQACCEWVVSVIDPSHPLFMFCGMGNNGGDGLALARLLYQRGFDIRAYVVYSGGHFSADCEQNGLRLDHIFPSGLRRIREERDFPEILPGCWIIDALFGTGLSRPVSGLAAHVVERINRASQRIISIDLPSGMRADATSLDGPVVQATHTLSLGHFKLSFFMAENAPFTGKVHLLSIGLHPDFIRDTDTPYRLTDQTAASQLYRPREAFSHKGSYGHALLVAGSHGKMGAAVLCARSCLRAGAGLVTARIPAVGYDILQVTAPEAMVEMDDNNMFISSLPSNIGKYQAIGVGPGLGTHPQTIQVLQDLLEVAERPIVLDADALNILGAWPDLLHKLPCGSLLTPHPKEFERLFGKTGNDFERLELQRRMSVRYGVYLILKGHHTCVSTPEGDCHFNTSGNAGMATGGSGDVLTGILTALLAQGYSPQSAAILGVYLHGLAGDIAVGAGSLESLIASDLTEYLGRAFKLL